MNGGRRLVRHRTRVILGVLALLGVALWPTDSWAFAAFPSAIEVMPWWRGGSLCLAVLTALAVGRRWSLAAQVTGALVWTGFTAGCLAHVDAVHLPFLLSTSALAFLFVPMPLPPLARALLQAAALALTWTVFFAVNPRHLEDPLVVFAGAIGCTFAATAWAGGHLIHRLEQANQQQQVSLAEANERAQRLLHNVLPARVAERLERDPVAIAEQCDEVMVIFADIVGFTPRCASMAPADVVALLNQMFSAFDALTDRHGLEKIKTIGDAYMAAAGLPGSAPDAAGRAVELALALQDAIARLDGSLSLRIGMHAGPAVAGVIGTRKFSYDLWGDTVNTASRMESHGEPGRIHVTDAVRVRLAERYRFEPRGLQQIKGKGPMETFFLERAPALTAPAS